jgi:hypothetical protein
MTQTETILKSLPAIVQANRVDALVMLDCVNFAMLKMSGERFPTFDFGDLRQSPLQK